MVESLLIEMPVMSECFIFAGDMIIGEYFDVRMQASQLACPPS